MTSSEMETARQIVEQWFWQPAEGHNYRYRGAVRTLTRYYESASLEPDEVKLVIAYLRDQVIAGEISLCNKSVDLGTGWKAMDAYYRTDETEKWSGTESRKVRVYQVLIQAPSGTDAVDGPYEVDKGGQYKVTHSFYWNAEALPTVPEPSSGVNYALEGVMRDRETGLYSAVMVKRERVQQDIPEYVTSTNAFETTKEEVHLGVRGAESLGGKAASCGGGKTTTRNITKNPDGTHDVHNVTTQKKLVRCASVEVHKTRRGVTRTVTHQSEAAPTANAADMELGESRTSRKTDGKRFDNVETKHTPPIGKVEAQRSKSVSSESVEVSRTIICAAEAAQAAEPVPPPEVNVIRKRTIRYDDNTADVTDETRTMKPIDTKEITLWKDEENECVMRSFRNQEEHDGLFPQDDVVGRIDASLQKNDHGSWNGGYTIVRPRTDCGEDGVLIIDEGKSETFAVGVRYGKWVWTNQLNETGWIGKVWECRRVCTMKARYVNLTKARAHSLARQLVREYTRTVWGSEWNGTGTGGQFEKHIVGVMCMAKIFPYRISGDVWGVRLIFDEQTTRLSKTFTSNSSFKFYEESGWGYPGEE